MIETMRLIGMTVSIAITIIIVTVTFVSTPFSPPNVPVVYPEFSCRILDIFRNLPLWSPGRPYPEKGTAGFSPHIFFGLIQYLKTG